MDSPVREICFDSAEWTATVSEGTKRETVLAFESAVSAAWIVGHGKCSHPQMLLSGSISAAVYTTSPMGEKRYVKRETL